MTGVLKLIKFEEGYKRFPYRCPAGKLTVGIGRNLDANGISEEEAEYLANQDIQRAETELAKRLEFFASLDDVRKAVLISMVFQMGIAAVMEFSRTLGAVGSGDYELAAQCMLESKWARQTPERAKRAAEMMRAGQWLLESDAHADG